MTVLTGLAALVVAQAAPAGATQAGQPWRPVVMAALGDSISAGFNACGWYVTCASHSWSTGDHRDVRSHYLRLREADVALAGHNVNLAVPGSTSADLAGQVKQAIDRRADYVTVLVGAQDACASEERLMTSVAVYESRVAGALALLRTARPDARVFVASIPDLRRLWQAGRNNLVARGFWAVGRICPTVLAHPTSTSAADQARRDRVRARVIGFNAALARVCAVYGPNCRFDGNEVFRQAFTLSHISMWDFFHPNAAGQRLIAEKTYGAMRDWLAEDDREPVLAP
ncbi:GDSL-type esterase/lipase family protein [Streptosporangium sp. NBC_01755]|uniref:SGNH/GDSL hydrolase family protein n=1 Tax=unclassified Streptosporangium TaxID=2632669 RepID=UPI002DDA9480|nr:MULTISPECIES: GDSL-type esterase/lipase family protein [unclassified Streptosporangium]WSA28887.1 GDSL-type esterase/lipase family protein [Streptosporangium sp. NBC_01810]WSC99667.1 GDSL-type esterase/lipase family protein [Streptosporangium sp. NBC_01755]